MSNLFGRVIEVISKDVKFDNTGLDIEFNIEFDNDLTPNISELTVYNLSETTLKNLKVNNPITINAGYKGDKGVIASGRITQVNTPFSGSDKATTIKILDSITSNDKRTIKQKWKNGISAKSIIEAMAKHAGLKIGQIKLAKNPIYKKGYTAEGNLLEELEKVAKDCGVSAYVSQGQLFVRSIREGDNTGFILSSDTGLIGTPEYFEEEQNGLVTKGYKITSLLQHRMRTGSIITLKSESVNAKLRVRKGKHTGGNTGDSFYTEVEALF